MFKLVVIGGKLRGQEFTLEEGEKGKETPEDVDVADFTSSNDNLGNIPGGKSFKGKWMRLPIVLEILLPNGRIFSLIGFKMSAKTTRKLPGMSPSTIF